MLQPGFRISESSLPYTLHAEHSRRTPVHDTCGNRSVCPLRSELLTIYLKKRERSSFSHESAVAEVFSWLIQMGSLRLYRRSGRFPMTCGRWFNVCWIASIRPSISDVNALMPAARSTVSSTECAQDASGTNCLSGSVTMPAFTVPSNAGKRWVFSTPYGAWCSPAVRILMGSIGSGNLPTVV